MDTFDHFIFLERPEGSDIADSPAFAPALKYERVVPQRLVMPSSQGEGATEHRDDSHFARFLAIKSDYAALLAANPSFAPAWPAADNPVMRKPMDPAGRVYTGEPRAAALAGLGNALYGQMLHFLVQAYGAQLWLIAAW